MSTPKRNFPRGGQKRKLRSDTIEGFEDFTPTPTPTVHKGGRPKGPGKQSLKAASLNSRMMPPSPAKSARASAQKAKATIRSSSKATVTHFRSLHPLTLVSICPIIIYSTNLCGL